MSSLNLSANGPSITKSYQSVINAPPPQGASASSPTYGNWAVFSVAAPLANAFQQDSGKESVMKVQSTGEGELIDFIEEFSDGRIQFGYLRVKDPNTALLKYVLVGWCGEGVPERTKGYFTGHLAAVSKLLQGYHVQVTARSDRDLTPEGILQKVSDASGSKYSGAPAVAAKPPPVASKPVFQPTKVGGGSSSFAPLGARTRVLPTPGAVDGDGWGEDAPQITRTQLEKVGTAYKPTKVNLAEYSHAKKSPEAPDVVRGAYQPIGKVDIAEIRRQAQGPGSARDDRPTVVKGAYEPVGKVDIAAIRARAQPSAEPQPQQITGDDEEAPKTLSDRSAAFQQSERLTTLPKPRVANKFGGASNFSGTRAPVPAGFTPKVNPTAAPVGTASRTFADKGGKTPAQIWAEKKALGGGAIAAAAVPAAAVGVLASQKSGDGAWKSGYSGKSWAPVQTTRTGQSATSNSDEPLVNAQQEEEDVQPSGISSIRDRFAAAPPPMDFGSKPNAGPRSVPPPPEPVDEDEEEEEERPASPIRVALPVRKAAEPEPEPEPAPRPVPVPVAAPEPAGASGGRKAIVQYDYEKAEDNEIELKEGDYVTEIEEVDPDWWMGRNVQGHTGLFPSNYVEIVQEGEEPAERAAPPPPAPAAAEPEAGATGPTATAEFEYDAAEDNELSFPEGATILNVEFPDDDWWLGEYNGKQGLFPSNYVKINE